MAATDVSRSLFIDSVRENHTDIQRALPDKTETQKCFSPNLPSFVTSHQTWLPAEFQDEQRYIVYLSEDDKLELDKALAFFNSLGLDGNLVNRANFPLHRLQRKLQTIAEDIHDGKGFCVIRGLEPDRYPLEDNTVVFLGIQSYIAEKRMRQDEAGNMLVHVISNPSDIRLSQHVRHSTDTIPFHTDPDADVLGFHTRGTPLSGGRFVLASGYSVYNELARTRPDIIATLAAPDWPFAFPYFHQRPVLFHHDSRIIFCFTRLALLGNKFYPRPSSIPSINPKQQEALDALNTIAEKNRIEITLQPGDIHFANNLSLLHRRGHFIDDDTHKRHLVRMHLRNEKLGWKIPDQLKVFWDNALDEEREESWHLEPMSESHFPLKDASH